MIDRADCFMKCVLFALSQRIADAPDEDRRGSVIFACLPLPAVCLLCLMRVCGDCLKRFLRKFPERFSRYISARSFFSNLTSLVYPVPLHENNTLDQPPRDTRRALLHHLIWLAFRSRCALKKQSDSIMGRLSNAGNPCGSPLKFSQVFRVQRGSRLTGSET